MKPKSIKFAAMTIHEANLRLVFRLYELYDDREAANIADLVMENLTGWKRIDRAVNKEVKMSPAMEQLLENYTLELLTHKPVQYVLHEAWFAGMKLFVDENVLIPRPETEELADMVIKDVLKNPNGKNIKTIIDIGTGSGCIPIAIKNKIPQTSAFGIDVSESALTIARKNAEMNNVEVNFISFDIFDESKWDVLPSFDIIVSNPPYIPANEKHLMQDNVTKFEPHLALFVPDNDPLVFYKAISRLAQKKLLPGGQIFLEMHENFAERVKELFSSFRDVHVMKDMQMKERFLIIAPLSYQP